MFMERSLLVDDELYGDEPREQTALNWPPPMVLPEQQAAVRGPAITSAGTTVTEVDEEMPELHLFARAARATRGPILVLGTAVTVALSGGYAAGHAFGWKMSPRLRASVSPALTTFINEQIPALVARPGTPLWCPEEEAPLPAEQPQADVEPSGAGQAKTEVAADPSTSASFFESVDRRTIALLPRLRRPFQERERPAAPWRGVVWSPRANALVSLSTPGAATLVASQPARAPDEAAMRFVVH